MYCYIYDSFLQNNKYARTLAKIEARITDLGLNGKIARLSPLKDLQEIIESESKKGCQTIVIVGNDNTLTQAVSTVAAKDATLGFIPVGPDNLISQTLGIPKEEKACDVLSARLITKLDLGQINSHYFLTQIEGSMENLEVVCNNKFTIKPQGNKHYLKITNLHPFTSNPQDGLLEVVVESPKNILKRTDTTKSTFIAKNIELNSSSPVDILIEKQKIIKTPLQISCIPRKLKIIVGKQREF